MFKAISNTSPLLYLYRIGTIEWLPRLFHEIWIPKGVVAELQEGRQRGYDTPDPNDYNWLRVTEPHFVPSEWFSLDLGAGELHTMALALENRDHVVLLDDEFARRVAQAAGLTVWGTLKVLLEAKSQGFTENICSIMNRLKDIGMWISDDLQDRVSVLAGEKIK